MCQNGVFGGRMLENAIRCGGNPVVVEDKWGEPVDPQKLEDALKKNRDAKVVAFVHAETSTGCQSDAKLLTQIAHKHGALVIVDAVTSLGGSPVRSTSGRSTRFTREPVPVVHAGALAGLVLRARGRAREEAEGQDP